MAADQTTVDRMKAVKSALESAVTAALPLALNDASFKEQMEALDQQAKQGDSSEYLIRYKELGVTSHNRNVADKDFKYALTVLGVDPNSDYGISVILAAVQTANLVVIVSKLLDCSPDEVWQNYLLNDDTVEGMI